MNSAFNGNLRGAVPIWTVGL